MSPPAPSPPGLQQAAAATSLGRRAPHRLALELKRRIDIGVYERGAWLPTEQKLAKELSVGRAALREALVVLECLDLVRSCGRSGVKIVGDSSVEARFAPSIDVLALLEACRLIETEAAALVAGLEDQPCAALTRRSGPVTTEDCRDFHLALAGETRNAVLEASIRNLWDLTLSRPALRATFDAAMARCAKDVRPLRRALVEALAKGGPEAARQAVRALFDCYLSAALDVELDERLRRAALESEARRRLWRGRIAERPVAGG